MYSSVCLFLFLHFCELNVFIARARRHSIEAAGWLILGTDINQRGWVAVVSVTNPSQHRVMWFLTVSRGAAYMKWNFAWNYLINLHLNYTHSSVWKCSMTALHFVNTFTCLLIYATRYIFLNFVRYNSNHVLHQLLPPKRTFTIICDDDLIPLLFPQKTTVWLGRIFCIGCYLFRDIY